MKSGKRAVLASIAMAGSMMTAGCGEDTAEFGVYEVSLAEAKDKLSAAEVNFTEAGCDQIHTIRSAELDGNILRVNIESTKGAEYTRTCNAVVEAAEEGKVRVKPDCGEMEPKIGPALAEFGEMEIEEFVMAKLNGEDLNVERIVARRNAIAARHMGDIPEGALEPGHGPSDEALAYYTNAGYVSGQGPDSKLAAAKSDKKAM